MIPQYSKSGHGTWCIAVLGYGVLEIFNYDDLKECLFICAIYFQNYFIFNCLSKESSFTRSCIKSELF